MFRCISKQYLRERSSPHTSPTQLFICHDFGENVSLLLSYVLCLCNRLFPLMGKDSILGNVAGIIVCTDMVDPLFVCLCFLLAGASLHLEISIGLERPHELTGSATRKVFGDETSFIIEPLLMCLLPIWLPVLSFKILNI